MRIILRSCGALCVLVCGLVLMTGPVAGGVIYSTAMSAPTNPIGGLGVYSTQFVGMRFQITGAPVTARGIGGDFGAAYETVNGDYHLVGNGEIFAALYQINGPSELPVFTPQLQSQGLLATAVFAPPQTPPFPAAELIVPISPVMLTPGWYLLAFGSGQLGASGYGYAPSNPLIGTPNFIGNYA